MFESLAPYIISLLLLPLVVKAKVSHAYASTFTAEAADIQELKPLNESKDKSVKGRKVIPLEKPKVVIIKDQPSNFEFKGRMSDALSYLQTISTMLVILSCIFVWWTKNEVIFP